MKTLRTLILALAAMVAGASFAASVVTINSPQSGTLTFSGAGIFNITNSFAAPYTQPPIVTFSSTSTSAYPITNNFVTTTNFSVSVANTNVQISWSSYAAYPRLAMGTNAVQPALLVTNTYGFNYAATPTITISGSGLAWPATATNSMVTLTNVTASSFVLVYPNAQSTNQVIHWQAIGLAAQPGQNGVVTY